LIIYIYKLLLVINSWWEERFKCEYH